MNNKNIKAVIFDLDGTLAESKQPLTLDMADMIRKLTDHMPVAVMSGGDLPQFEQQFLAHLSSATNFSNLFIFPTSGAECLIYTDGQWKEAYDNAFNSEEKNKVIKAIRAVIEKISISKGEHIYGDQIEDRGEQITFSALGQEAPLEVKSVWDPDQKKRTGLKEEIEKIIPEFDVRIGGMTSIDITPKDISKKTGVEWLAKHLGVDAEHMLYVGDALYPGGNDTAVLPTHIQTQQVSGPEETKKVIESFL